MAGSGLGAFNFTGGPQRKTAPLGGTATIPPTSKSMFPDGGLSGGDGINGLPNDWPSGGAPSAPSPAAPAASSWNLETQPQHATVPAPADYWDNGQGAGAPAAGGEDYSTPQSQLASLAGLIKQGGGWNGTTPEYFQQRINETGGFTPGNIAYWKDMILGGFDAHAASEQGGQQDQGGDTLSALAASGGHSPFGADIEATLKRIIDSGGVTPNIAPGLINAREDEARAEQGQLADARGQLAEAGGMSEPGVAQGTNIGAIERVQQNVAPSYASAVRDVETKGLQEQNDNLMSALQLATGMSTDDAHNIISAVGTGMQGKVALANIALDQLKQSDSWNEFLAQNGLDQAKLQNDINQGHWDNAIRLLQIYTQGGGIAAGGLIQ